MPLTNYVFYTSGQIYYREGDTIFCYFDGNEGYQRLISGASVDSFKLMAEVRLNIEAESPEEAISIFKMMY
jgi:hypothetical protein